MEDLSLLPLFARMLTESGTTTLDEVALSRKIGSETGGLSATFHSELKYVTVFIITTLTLIA